MADSNITKQAMGTAFKELLEDRPFEKISVSDICDRCNMNRKSFYYHFKDKYDLANWIFDSEFVELMRQHDLDVMNTECRFEERWRGLSVACEYFYENRTFYRRILKVEGQNSFASHFRAFMYPVLEHRVRDIVSGEEVPRMTMDFIVDGLICPIERWLLGKNCVTAEEFTDSLKALVNLLILGMKHRLEAEPDWVEKLYR